MSWEGSETLGQMVRAHREHRGLTQDALAAAAGEPVNRSAVAHLEQGLRVPPAEALEAICSVLDVPPALWRAFVEPRARTRMEVEAHLSELVGSDVGLRDHAASTVDVVHLRIDQLFATGLGPDAAFDQFNSLLIIYGIPRVTGAIFERYLGVDAFGSVATFGAAVERYQRDAIRLFSTFGEAWRVLNRSDQTLAERLAPLGRRDLRRYSTRTAWSLAESIADEDLPDLGYISASVVRKESAERRALTAFLGELAGRIRDEGRRAVDSTPTHVRRKMDSLLRKFETELTHGLFSPLFVPDPDELDREAERLAPKSEAELARMQRTQEAGLRNLSHYLAADHMDVYVATSMRTRADFRSVNGFVRALFEHTAVAPLQLRHFNPTQSWIDDRIAKGLVEALMLRRADVTIYMAQKSDTFGKDSEASVALGQGKPVIVYVPRLRIPAADGLDALDAEALSRMHRVDLLALLPQDGTAAVDESVDDEALVARVIARRLQAASERALVDVVREVWADFDLYGEVGRIDDQEDRAAYRATLDAIVAGETPAIATRIQADLIGILVAVATRFEKRARLFREIHPLALQVILSTGVLNGMLVVRSVDECAEILRELLQNDLSLSLEKDERNYRLIERRTGSTIRVISRHRLLRNAFEAFGRG